jgi:hypothetical protein
MMKKYLIGIAILGVAITLFGYAFIHGTPEWLESRRSKESHSS